MNGDIYRLREEMLERLVMLTERMIEAEEVSASAVSIADSALQDFEKRIAALEGNSDYGKVLARGLGELEAWRGNVAANLSHLINRVEKLEANKCQCGNKVTKELRTSFVD